MPSLRVFGRRSIFSGDDLQPTAILNIFFRAFQLFLLLVPVYIHISHEATNIISEQSNDDEGRISRAFFQYLFGGNDIYPQECESTSHYFPLLLYMHLISSLGHITLSLVLEYIIFKVATIGTPTKYEMRSPILSQIVEKKWIWVSIVGNVVVLVFGMTPLIFYKAEYYECHHIILGDDDDDGGGDGDGNNNDGIANTILNQLLGRSAWWILWILLISSQAMELILSLAALGKFLQKEKAIQFIGQNGYGTNGTGSGTTAFDDYSIHGPRYQQHHHELAEEMWDTRCRNFCKCAASSTCFLFGGRDLVDRGLGDYGQVSRALADYFEDGGVLDLVPSDLAAGFIMLQRVQRQRVLQVRRTIAQEMKSSGGRLGMSSQHSSGINISYDEDLSLAPSSASSSTIGHDMHNFGDSHADRKIMSALDHHEASIMAGMQQPISQHDYTDHMFVGGGGISIEPPAIVDNMLVSVLQPMPYSTTLLLPEDGDTDNDTLSPYSSPYKSSALMLRMAPTESRDSQHFYEAQQRKVFDKDDEGDKFLMAEGARFARHALSIYTWLLYFYMHPVKSIPHLMYDRLAECCRRKPKSKFFNDLDANQEHGSCFNVSHGNTTGDNFLHVHRNALMAHSGLDEADLIYANFNNKYNQMPYCIVVDHKWQSVVVSIRGTLSLEDCLVDVLVDPESLEDLGNQYGFDAQGEYCHSGVLACVRSIMHDIERHNILDSLLKCVGAEYPHYKLRLTGHSLGAGCATLLGYILKQKFPDLRVVAISPPGGFLTHRLATECKSFVTSFVLDSDLVPRLSVATMEHLRNEILDLIGRIKIPKMQVAKTFVIHGLRKGVAKESDDPDSLAIENSEMLHPKDTAQLQTDFHRQLEKFQAIQSERRQRRGNTRDIALYPPGKIVHLVKTGERSTCRDSISKIVTCCTSNSGYEYTPVWADNKDFNEIVVSPTMAFDHFPNRVCLEIERVAASFGIDTSLGSTESDRYQGESLREHRLF